MRPQFNSYLSLGVLALTGCGTTARTPTTPAAASPAPVVPSLLSSLPGDWLALAGPIPGATSILADPIANFSGAIAVSGTTITGIFRAFAIPPGNGCPSIFTPIPFTGMLDANDTFTLTAPLSGGMATITATLPMNLRSRILGTYQIVGGTCPMPSTAMTLSQYASATGTYTGTFHGSDITSLPPKVTPDIAITATLAESPTPSIDGTFPLTGTVTSAGPCIGQLVISSGFVSGGGIYSKSLVSHTAPVGTFSGELNPSATSILGTFYLLSCESGVAYSGGLTRQ